MRVPRWQDFNSAVIMLAISCFHIMLVYRHTDSVTESSQLTSEQAILLTDWPSLITEYALRKSIKIGFKCDRGWPRPIGYLKSCASCEIDSLWFSQFFCNCNIAFFINAWFGQKIFRCLEFLRDLKRLQGFDVWISFDKPRGFRVDFHRLFNYYRIHLL